MKAVLEFQLPEETEEHQNALKGTLYKGALQEMDNYFRNKIKYEELPGDVRVSMENAREALHQAAQHYGIDIWD